MDRLEHLFTRRLSAWGVRSGIIGNSVWFGTKVPLRRMRSKRRPSRRRTVLSPTSARTYINTIHSVAYAIHSQRFNVYDTRRRRYFVLTHHFWLSELTNNRVLAQDFVCLYVCLLPVCSACIMAKWYLISNRKSPANANRNAQQPRCMFESPVKQSLSQSPEGAKRQAAIVSIVFYSYLPEGVTCLAQPTPYRLDIANFPYTASLI